MAINSNYIRPQSEVHQLLNVTVSGGQSHGHACIIGAQYDLYRYGKEELPSYKYGEETASITLQYDTDPTGLIDYIVDEQSIQLFGKDILAKVITVTDSVEKDGEFYTVLKAPTEKYWAADYSTDAATKLVCENYSVTIGDIILTADGKKAKVVALIASDDNPVAFDKIKVSNNLFDLTSDATSLTGISVCRSFTGVLDNTFTYTKDTNVVAVNTTEQTLTVKGKDNKPVTCTLLTGHGEVYVEFRVLVSYQHDTVDGLIQLDSVDDIQNKLGSIDVNNELAYACYSALKASDGITVYAVRVANNTPEAFLESVQKTESNSNVYAFVPVTTDISCIEKIVEFNDAMSTATVKKWRINIIGVDVNDSAKVSYDNQGIPLRGNFYSKSSGSKTTSLLQISEDSIANGFDVYQYSIGDIITLQDDQAQTEYVVKAILADNLVQLVNGPGSLQAEVSFSIKRSNSSTSNINYAKYVAGKFNSRRTIAVWCDGGKNDGVIINNVYIAAEIAGLTSAAAPHQGITNVEIKSIDSAPKMYSRYTQDQLDDVAAHGVLVIAQDTNATTPYIRHQLTTCPDKGILYSELSCTRNIDNISYGVADIVKYYVGRANVVDQALQHIESALITYWNSCASTVTDQLLGPALVNYSNYSIVQDPKAMDRIIINVDYYIPSPLNGIAVYQMVYVASVTL